MSRGRQVSGPSTAGRRNMVVHAPNSLGRTTRRRGRAAESPTREAHVSLRGRDSKSHFQNRIARLTPGFPVIVLVNKTSARGSEIPLELDSRGETVVAQCPCSYPLAQGKLRRIELPEALFQGRQRPFQRPPHQSAPARTAPPASHPQLQLRTTANDDTSRSTARKQLSRCHLRRGQSSPFATFASFVRTRVRCSTFSSRAIRGGVVLFIFFSVIAVSDGPCWFLFVHRPGGCLLNLAPRLRDPLLFPPPRFLATVETLTMAAPMDPAGRKKVLKVIVVSLLLDLVRLPPPPAPKLPS